MFLFSAKIQVKQAPVKQQVQKAHDADVELDDFQKAKNMEAKVQSMIFYQI